MGQGSGSSWAHKTSQAKEGENARNRRTKEPVSEELASQEGLSEARTAALGTDFSEGTFNRHVGHLSGLLDAGPAGAAEIASLVPNLQRSYGNQYVSRLFSNLQRSRAADVRVSAAPRPTPAPGQGPAEEEEVAREAGPEAMAPELAREVDPRPGAVSERGPVVGTLDGKVISRAFVDGGSTGTDTVWWAGGGAKGAQGNQGVGTIQKEVKPVYDQAAPAGAGQKHTAWVRNGTGLVEVKRSYVSVKNGANGSDWYITSKANTRIETHEKGHVNKSSDLYNQYIKPAEDAATRYTGKANAVEADSAEKCKSALLQKVKWASGMQSFKGTDRTQNIPGGTWDTQEQATADWYYDYGAKKVGQKNYAHYVDQTPGPQAGSGGSS